MGVTMEVELPGRSTEDLIRILEREPRRPQHPIAREHATLTCVEGPMIGRVVGLGPDDTVVLGRDPSVAVAVADASVSRRHARIVGRGGRFVVSDLDSFRGTWVDGVRVRAHERRVLEGPCRLQLGGHVSFRFDKQSARERRVLTQLHDASVRDPLTGAFNRRYLEDRLRTELSYALRQGIPLAVAMFDIDRFKDVNDAYGHDAGDLVLVALVEQVQRMIRPEDVFVRYGGEEFCLLLRNLDARNAEILAERIRKEIERLPIPSPVNGPLRVTVSAGVAGLEGHPGDDSESLIRAADSALYRAKANGRNQVVRATDDDA